MLREFKNYLLGKPLSVKAIRHERLTNTQGLAIFGSDALSSTAYATEEILLVLVGAGAYLTFASIPIAFCITILIFLIAVSYRQVIHAYPQGGGVYNVAKQNLGELPSLIGAASLLVDYILTAAVSIAAGVAAITSTFDGLYQHRVIIGILFIAFLAWMNLRGVRESGRLFSIPTYAFVASFAIMISYGIWRLFEGTLPVAPAITQQTESLGLLGIVMVLRAFAAGCTAMTGIEATSNGVQAFKSPEADNASKTLIYMAFILGSIFLGITVLGYYLHVTPSDSETVISQIARTLFGRNFFYFLIQGATALILLLAANTPFAGFPRVASQLAKDGYFPRQFLNLGSRLVFGNGIIFLSLVSALLIYLFQGKVHALIPLYAVGVFLGFSLSQWGMIRHWLKTGQPNKRKIAINVVGLAATTIVLGIVFFFKFLHGAWMLVPAIAILVFWMKKIKSHYTETELALSLEGNPIPDIFPDKTIIVLVSSLNRAALHAIKFAATLSPAHIQALHVAISNEDADSLRAKWAKQVPAVPIDILVDEYRDLIGPIIQYLKNAEKRWEGDSMIVILPELVPKNFWGRLLHNQTATYIRIAIEQDPEINAEIIEVPIKMNQRI